MALGLKNVEHFQHLVTKHTTLDHCSVKDVDRATHFYFNGRSNLDAKDHTLIWYLSLLLALRFFKLCADC